MANFRRTISKFVGGAQCVIGVIAAVFAFIIYAYPVLRETIAITSEGELHLYMFISSIFGVISILSGLLILQEEK